MKAREIANRLIESAKGVTTLRVQKAQALAQRSGVQWVDVLDSMAPHERASVEKAA